MSDRTIICIAVLAAGFYMVLPFTAPAEPSADAPNSCITCHGDPGLLVTNRKLFEYYRDWDRSIHRQEDVTCSDCHGGKPEASGRDEAHAGVLGEASGASSVNFAHVHETCGDCHSAMQSAYLESDHYENLVDAEEEKQGPSCVTCHGSMNTLTLDVTTVEATCSHCHNEETENQPEIPGRARSALNKFLSIDRFHRYVSVRMEPSRSRLFLEQIDRRIHELSVLWHTFDLDGLETETNAVLDQLKQKRDEIRQRSSTAGAAPDATRSEGVGTDTPEAR